MVDRLADRLWHALAPSTLAQVLAAIEQLYVTVREIKGDDILDDLIAHHEYGHLAVVLEAHFVKLANKAVRLGADHSNAWESALKFKLLWR